MNNRKLLMYGAIAVVVIGGIMYLRKRNQGMATSRTVKSAKPTFEPTLEEEEVDEEVANASGSSETRKCIGTSNINSAGAEKCRRMCQSVSLNGTWNPSTLECTSSNWGNVSAPIFGGSRSQRTRS